MCKQTCATDEWKCLNIIIYQFIHLIINEEFWLKLIFSNLSIPEIKKDYF